MSHAGDGDVRAAIRYLNMGMDLDMFVEGLTIDTASALFTKLNRRIGDSKSVHDYPPRPSCWACGHHWDEDDENFAQESDLHAEDCIALLSWALGHIDDDGQRLRSGEPTYREYFGGILDRGRAAGADMKKVRRDPEALARWCDPIEPPA